MNIEINTEEIAKEIEEEIKYTVGAWINSIVEQRVSTEVSRVLNERLDRIEKTPYEIINYRISAALDKYIEQEVEKRALIKREMNDTRSET